MKIRNTFDKIVINKDVDERLLPNGTLFNAENIRIANTEGSDMGAIENALGNFKRSNIQYVNGVCIGAKEDSSNNKIYFFVTSDTKDGVFEYDDKTKTTLALLESVKGGVLNFSKDHLITGVTKTTNEDYTKDLLIWTDNLNPPRMINIERSKNFLFNLFEEEDISLIKKPPLYEPSIQLSQSDVEGNSFIEDKFLSFAYRYIYEDNQVSTLSPFSDVAFIPKDVNVNFYTGEDEGMVNSFNQVLVLFNTGDKRVKEVEVVFKESGKNTLYLVDTYNKEDKGWVDNSVESILLDNRKVRRVLPEDVLRRPYDNVPTKAKALDIVSSRLVMGNYTEGYDLKDSLGKSITFDINVENRASDNIDPELLLGTLENNGTINYPLVGDIEDNKISFDLISVPLKKDSVLSFNFKITNYPIPQMGSETQESINNRNDYDNWYRSPFGGGFGYIDPLPAEGVDPDGAGSIPTYTPPSRIYEYTEGSYSTYNNSYQYILTKDFSSVEELANDAEFINFINVLLTSYFYDNYTLPTKLTTSPIQDDIVPPIVENPFELVYDINNPTTIEINSPSLTITVDDGGGAVVETMYTRFDNSLLEGSSENELNSISYQALNNTKSVKSLRNYEVGVVYRDKWGRKSSVLTSDNNTTFLDVETISTTNKLVTTINSQPPYWANTYSLYVKSTPLTYKNIFCSNVYEDGDFVWFPLNNVNKDFISEGDTLILKQDLAGTVDTYNEFNVLEVSSQNQDFIPNNGKTEPAGLYFKTDRGIVADFDSSSVPAFGSYGDGRRRFLNETTYYSRSPYSGSLTAGSTIRIYVNVNGSKWGEIVFDKTYVLDKQYDSLRDWHEQYLKDEASFAAWRVAHTQILDIDVNNSFRHRSKYEHPRASRKLNTNFHYYIEFANPIIFETKEDTSSDLEVFYEAIGTFPIINGNHQGNEQDQDISTNTPAIVELNYYNCFKQSASVESYMYKNVPTLNKLQIDQSPSGELKEDYGEVVRYADLTYSENFSEGTGKNGLNTFDLTKANYKDDIEKKYGSIQKIFSRDTDILVFQEDKVSRVLYNKNALTNTDGSTNLSATDVVLGQQIAYSGEYGISNNPESFATQGTNVFFTDAKRGAVMKLGGQGLFEISSMGMKTFFKQKFRDNLRGLKVGGIDPYFDQYILSVKDEEGGYTISYDPRQQVNGFTSFWSYVPDWIQGLNNKYFTFKNGDIYEHHHEGTTRNTFYGTKHDSKVSIIMNTEPSVVKLFQNISLEGNKTWDIELKAFIDDKDNFNGSSLSKDSFVQKEGVWFAYTRRNDKNISYDSKDVYGIGQVSNITGQFIEVNTLNSSLCAGDSLYKVFGNDVVLVGDIIEVLPTGININLTNSLNINDYIFGKKNSTIEGGSLRGYSMSIDLTNDDTDRVELYAVASEVKPSYPI